MENIINLNESVNQEFFERFERLKDIIPECMDGISENPFIQYIKEYGKVRESLVDFLNQSDFLELLTPKLIQICQKLFDADAGIEWYKLMLFIMEEKEDMEAICENVLHAAKNKAACESVREAVEKNVCTADIVKEIAACIPRDKEDQEKKKDKFDDGNAVEQSDYVELCNQQRAFISQLMEQNEALTKIVLAYQMQVEKLQKNIACENEETRCKELKEEVNIRNIEKQEEENEFQKSKMILLESGLQTIKRKSNWFTNLVAQYSKKSFLKNSRQDQENLIFIKMMEMQYPMEKVQKIKKALVSENISCFELYKMICKDSSVEELDIFLKEYVASSDMTETNAAVI